MPEPDGNLRGSSGAAARYDELSERQKELSFLHHAARLINMRGEPRDILRAALELLPSAMCHPELASARLAMGPLAITTAGHESTELCMRAEVNVGATSVGVVEVCYAAPPPPSDPPAFLDEERSLLASFAQLLKAYFERFHAEEASRRLIQAEAAEQSAVTESRAKDLFLGNVAHEMRSSLHVMLGWIELLREGSQPADMRARGFQILERNVALQAKLIEDLLDLSRIVSGKLELDCRRVDLAELVGFAIDATRPAADAKQLQLTAELEPVGHVMGDAQRLQQVVYNLLGNAVKFTRPTGRIHIGLTREKSRARIVVQDTGVGIDDEFLPRIFDRFRQASSVTKGRSSGLGLGLPIAKHLVELHHGVITVRSNRPEPGTTFEISLPLDG
jgi:signal transduction histidine kinase